MYVVSVCACDFVILYNIRRVFEPMELQKVVFARRRSYSPKGDMLRDFNSIQMKALTSK